MRFLSFDGEPAVIGVGQMAQGIFAFGQFARGFVAVGQIAIGVFALGQVCVAVVGVGQVGFGVTWFAAMLGIGGRGICLRLIPGLDPPRTPPELAPFEVIAHGTPKAEGYVRVQVIDTPRGARLALGGQALPVKPTPQMAYALTQARRKNQVNEVFAHVKRAGLALVCDGAIEIPGARRTYALWLQIVRVVLLCGLATAWWYAFSITPD